MVQCFAGRVFCKPDSRCGITLRVAVDEEGTSFGGRQASGPINGSGSLANTALLVCTSDDSCQMFPHAKLSKRCAQLQVVSRGTKLCHRTIRITIPPAFPFEPLSVYRHLHAPLNQFRRFT